MAVEGSLLERAKTGDVEEIATLDWAIANATIQS